MFPRNLKSTERLAVNLVSLYCAIFFYIVCIYTISIKLILIKGLIVMMLMFFVGIEHLKIEYVFVICF